MSQGGSVIVSTERILASLLGATACLSPVPVAAQADTGTTATSTPTLDDGLGRLDEWEDDFDAPADVFEDTQPTLIIEAVEIIGNEKTTRTAVLRRAGVELGTLLNDDDLEASRLRLLGTGYFSAVEFSLERGSRRDRVVLVIEVEERNTITIDGLYYGGGAAAPFFGGFGILESNFLGRGVSAGAGFVAGRDRHVIDAHIFIPDLGRSPLQLSASGIFVLSGRESLVPDEPELGELQYSRIGGTIGLGFGVGPSQRFMLEYRLETIQVDRLPDLPPSTIRTAPSIQFDESILSTVALSFEHDTRDDAFVPSSGYRVALAIETGTSILGSSYEFSKYTGETVIAFAPFGHALSLKAFGGFIQGQTPFFNQFFLRDHTHFLSGEDSLPRALGLNYSTANDYDDLIFSAGVDYSLPLQRGHKGLYRTYLYAGLTAGVSASLDEAQEDLDGRGIGDRFPLSADIGLRFDTSVGNFTVSAAYLTDLAL